MDDYNEVCWACDVVVASKADLEWHHVVPAKNGGSDRKARTDRVTTDANCLPLCRRCHSLVDRIDYGSWMLWAMSEELKKPAPPWAKLTMLKQWSIILRPRHEPDHAP